MGAAGFVPPPKIDFNSFGTNAPHTYYKESQFLFFSFSMWGGFVGDWREAIVVAVDQVDKHA